MKFQRFMLHNDANGFLFPVEFRLTEAQNGAEIESTFSNTELHKTTALARDYSH